MPATATIVAVVVDVDGVVSPVHGRTDWGDDVVAGRVFGPVQVSPKLCHRLDRLTATPGVCGVWLTDWDAEMRASMHPFPGHSWSAIDRPWNHEHSRAPRRWWKFPALLGWLDANHNVRTVVWADDHLAKPYDPRLTAEDVEYGTASRADVLTKVLAKRGITAHLIAPDTAVGLTREHVRRIEQVVRVPG